MKFLSRRQIASHFHHVAATTDELSLHLRQGKDPQDGRGTADYAGLMSAGVEALLAPLSIYQPKTYAAITALQPELLVAERTNTGASGIPVWTAGAFVGGRDVYVRVEPYFSGLSVPKDRTDSIYYYRYASLPPAIADAYYGLTCGMEVIPELPGDPMISRVLPTRIDNWGVRGDSLCGRGKKALATMKANLTAIADPAAPPRKNGLVWESFACVLDSREQDVDGTTGDLLFVQEGSSLRRIFHVHDADFTSIRLVANPVRLYDEYVSWVFSGGEGRFDFCAYSGAV